jgi:hypothetical protein
MNDNFVNISRLLHRQIDLMERYHSNVNENMQRIDNCIQELLTIQRGRDRIVNRRTLTAGMDRLYGYPYTGNYNSRSNIGMRSPLRPSNRTIPLRNTRNRARNQMFYDNLRNANMLPTSRRRTRNYQVPRRRFTLQEFINSTLNSGNPRIPAQENEIMQQTSIINFEDLSGSNINTSTCPISLTRFDASSNILRINRCNHVFDSDSLMRWFREDSRCPICRYNISQNTTADNSGNNMENVNQDIFSIDGNSEQDDTDELPSNSAIIYDISFSIPHLFGRDMSDNQINTIIDSITSTITNSMTQNLSNHRINLNENEDVVVEEMTFQVPGNDNNEQNEQSNTSSDEEEIYV